MLKLNGEQVVGEGRFSEREEFSPSFELPASRPPQRVCRVFPYRAGVTQAELRMFLLPHLGDNTQIRNHTMLDHPPTLINYLWECETVFGAAGGI